MLCCYLNVFVYVYIIDLKEYSFNIYGLYKWMQRCQHSFKKIPSNLWVVHVGSISFQEISYAGKPQVLSRYILSNLWADAIKPMACNHSVEIYR